MKKNKQPKVQNTTISQQLAAFRASQNFRNTQVSRVRASSGVGAVVQRAKKRGDR